MAEVYRLNVQQLPALWLLRPAAPLRLQGLGLLFRNYLVIEQQRNADKHLLLSHSGSHYRHQQVRLVYGYF